MDHKIVGEEDPPHPLLCMTNNLRPKLHWTDQLHEVFVRAVNKLGGPFKATPMHILEEMNIKGLTIQQCKSHLQKFRLPPHAKIRKPPKDGPPKKPKPAKVSLKGAGSSSLAPSQVNHAAGKRALDPGDFQGASMVYRGRGDQVNLSTEGDGRSLQTAVEYACEMMGNHQDDAIENSIGTVVAGAGDGNNDGILAISMRLDDIFVATSGIIDTSAPPLPPTLNIYQQPTSSYSSPLITNQVIDLSTGKYFQPQMKDNIGDSSNPLTTEQVIDVPIGEYFQPQMNGNIGDSPYPLTIDQVIDMSTREYFQSQMNNNIWDSPNPLTTHDQVIDMSVGEYFQHQMNENIGDYPNLSAPSEVGTSSECSKEEDPTDMFLNMDALETLCDVLP